MSRSPFPLLLVAALVLLCGLPSSAWAQKERRKEVPKLPVPPPQPVPQEITVNRGESIEIRLTIYGRKNENLKYLIRTPPEGGKLTEPKVVAQEASVVTYQAPTNLKVKQDRFAYAVQNSAGVSAPSEVKITILDLDPQLIVPEGLEFPPVLTGESARKEFEISNIGGALSEGEVQVPAPWRVEGTVAYRLAHNESQKVTLVFEPREGTKQRGEIRYTSQLDRVTTLRGTGAAPLATEPPELTLQSTSAEPVRSARLELINNTDTELVLSLAASARLRVEPSVTIPPHDKFAVVVNAAEGDVQAIEEVLRISGSAQVEVPIHAAALGPLLKVTPPVLRFPSARLGQSVVLPITIANEGGRAGTWRWQVQTPFSMEAVSAHLAPGEKKDVRVTMPAQQLGRVQGTLKIEGEGGFQEVALEGEVIVVSAAVPLPTAASRLPKQTHASRPSPSNSSTRPPSRPGDAVDPDAEARMQALLYLKENVRITNVDQTRATVEWPASLTTARTCRVEIRTLHLDEQGNVRPLWQVPPGAKIRVNNGRFFADLEHLRPDSNQTIRVIPEGTSGEPNAPLFQTQFQTLAPQAPTVRITGFRLAICGFIALAVGAFAWQRIRQSRGLA